MKSQDKKHYILKFPRAKECVAGTKEHIAVPAIILNILGIKYFFRA